VWILFSEILAFLIFLLVIVFSVHIVVFATKMLIFLGILILITTFVLYILGTHGKGGGT